MTEEFPPEVQHPFAHLAGAAAPGCLAWFVWFFFRSASGTELGTTEFLAGAIGFIGMLALENVVHWKLPWYYIGAVFLVNSSFLFFLLLR